MSSYYFLSKNKTNLNNKVLSYCTKKTLYLPWSKILSFTSYVGTVRPGAVLVATKIIGVKLILFVSSNRRGRGFESRSEPEFFSGLCSSSVTAALALMTVITQLLPMDKINFTPHYTWAKYNVHI